MGVRRTNEHTLSPEQRWIARGVATVLGALAISIMPAATLDAAVGTPISTGVESHYPCDPIAEKMPRMVAKEMAQRCINDRYGNIVIVGVDIDATELQEIASDTQKNIHDATRGLIAPHITAMVASPAVLAEFHNMNIDCVNTHNLEAAGPLAADRLMNLGGFNHVIVDTNLPACNDKDDPRLPPSSAYGLSWSTNGWRYAEAFQAAALVGNKTYPKAHAEYISHEIGHLEGLDHAGSFTSFSDNQGKILSLLHFKQYQNLSSQPDIDLNNTLGSGNYDEYASPSNLMGAEFYDNNGAGLYLNGEQRQRLEWPERVMRETSDLGLEINGSDWVTINRPMMPNHTFGELHLHQPIQFCDSKGNLVTDPSFTFTSLVVDPVFDHQGNVSGMLEISLANSSDSFTRTMSLGFLDLSNPTESMRTLHIGDQTIKITADKDGNYIVSDFTGK